MNIKATMAVIAIIITVGFVASSSFILSAAAFSSSSGSNCGLGQSTAAKEKGGRSLGQGTSQAARSEEPNLGQIVSNECSGR